jgi:hypothetical protein
MPGGSFSDFLEPPGRFDIEEPDSDEREDNDALKDLEQSYKNLERKASRTSRSRVRPARESRD